MDTFRSMYIQYLMDSENAGTGDYLSLTANYEELRDLEEREKRKEKEHGRE